MPAPHPQELRERVLAARRLDGQTVAEVAARFVVGTASVKRWSALHRQQGSVRPRQPERRGPKCKLSLDDRVYLELQVLDKPQLSRADLWGTLWTLAASSSASSCVSAFVGVGAWTKRSTSPSSTYSPSCTRE
jgi:transposase